MFEKEAEKYYETETPMIENITGLDFQNEVTKAFKNGAEFGYNKANEWYYVKDGDLPDYNNLVLFKTKVNYYLGKIDRTKNCWWTGECLDNTVSSNFVIAWCEIPQFKE